MALITCIECGKQISDRASTCPHCGCPISVSEGEGSVTRTPPQTAIIPVKKRKKAAIIPIIALLVIAAIGAGLYVFALSPKKAYSEALELYNTGNYSEALSKFEALDTYSNSSELVVSCRYELGIDAMEIFDWETAASFFTDLSYEYSERMLTDCSFMIALEKSVQQRMETGAKESSDQRSLVTTELAYLEDFRNASFYNATIGTQAKKYIKGLDTQLSALSYDYYYEYQRDWNTGLVARYEVLNKLYTDFQFMADNKDFIGAYINQLDYHQKLLKAFNAIENNGCMDIDWRFAWNYVDIHFKNNTQYTFSPVFDIMFYGDEDKTKYLGTTTVVLNYVGPYSEYTVRAYYTEDAQKAYNRSGLWVYCHSYYQDIKIN